MVNNKAWFIGGMILVVIATIMVYPYIYELIYEIFEREEMVSVVMGVKDEYGNVIETFSPKGVKKTYSIMSLIYPHLVRFGGREYSDDVFKRVFGYPAVKVEYEIKGTYTDWKLVVYITGYLYRDNTKIKEIKKKFDYAKWRSKDWVHCTTTVVEDLEVNEYIKSKLKATWKTEFIVTVELWGKIGDKWYFLDKETAKGVATVSAEYILEGEIVSLSVEAKIGTGSPLTG